jgi:hypothetical protein
MSQRLHSTITATLRCDNHKSGCSVTMQSFAIRGFDVPQSKVSKVFDAVAKSLGFRKRGNGYVCAECHSPQPKASRKRNREA